jgi:hypothetical protein
MRLLNTERRIYSILPSAYLVKKNLALFHVIVWSCFIEKSVNVILFKNLLTSFLLKNLKTSFHWKDSENFTSLKSKLTVFHWNRLFKEIPNQLFWLKTLWRPTVKTSFFFDQNDFYIFDVSLFFDIFNVFDVSNSFDVCEVFCWTLGPSSWSDSESQVFVNKNILKFKSTLNVQVTISSHLIY